MAAVIINANILQPYTQAAMINSNVAGIIIPFSPAPLSPALPASPALSSAAPAEPDVSSPAPGFLAQSSPASCPQTSLRWRYRGRKYKQRTVAIIQHLKDVIM